MDATARRIVTTLRAAGHEAYFAGGCVRDHLLGSPPQDYDIATSARPEEVERLFRRTVAVGAQFGVIVVVEGQREYEVATFRADGVYLDGRRPESVTYADAEGDARRRDFTINGLFFDPVEARTWDAIRAGAAEIHAVSAERIRDELAKILRHPSRGRGFDLLDASGLLRELLPEVERLKGCEQPPDFHPEGDVFVHTRIMLGMLPEEVSLPLVLGVLFHDIGKPPTFHRDETGRIRFNGHESVSAQLTRGIMTRLRFSNAEIETTDALVQNHMAFKDVRQMRVAKLKRFLARETMDDELELHRVDCGSSHGLLDNYDFLLAKREEFANEPLIPPPLVTGHDLIALGWKPGPAFKETLEAVQTLQLEGGLHTRDEALAWLRARPSN